MIGLRFHFWEMLKLSKFRFGVIRFSTTDSI